MRISFLILFRILNVVCNAAPKFYLSFGRLIDLCFQFDFTNPQYKTNLFYLFLAISFDQIKFKEDAQ